MVTVTPIEGTNEFRLTVQRAGESTVAVSAQRMSKQLTVKAAHQGGAIVVEIAQQPVLPSSFVKFLPFSSPLPPEH
jgi:hypothetical protein